MQLRMRKLNLAPCHFMEEYFITFPMLFHDSLNFIPSFSESYKIDFLGNPKLGCYVPHRYY